MDVTKADSPAPPVEPASGARSCGECGSVLRAGAEFCTECGASALDPTEGAGGPAPETCAECGASLRAGAAFCTECGASRTAGAVGTAAAAPVGAAAAAVAADAADAGPTAPDEATSVKDRRSGPAESRTILAAVGSTGYSSPRGATSRPSPPVPPAVVTPPSSGGDNPRRKVLAIVAVLAVLAVAGIIVVAATQGKDENSVQAGHRAGDSSQLTSHVTNPLGSGDSGTGDPGTVDTGSATTAKPKPGKKGHTTTTVKAGPSTTSKPNGTVTHTTTKPSTATTVKSAKPPPPPPATTVPGAPPAKLSVSTVSVSLTAGSPSAVIRINNDGGSPMNWTANPSVAGIHGGTVSPHSGHLSAHGGINVTVAWAPGGSPEGLHNGSFSIDGRGAGFFTVGVAAGADTNAPDVLWGSVYAGPVGARCGVGKTVNVFVRRVAANGAVPSAFWYGSLTQSGGPGRFTPLAYVKTVTMSDGLTYDMLSATVTVAATRLDLDISVTDRAGNTTTKLNEQHTC